MPTVQLPDRAVIKVSGADARHFLQNILTTDIDALEPGEAKPGALLSPQGKILFDFLVSPAPDGGYLLDVRTEAADDFLRRLMLYRLRAKAEISKQEQLAVAASWQSDSGVIDRRFPAGMNVRRRYGEAVAADITEADWDRLRIDAGVAEGGRDFAFGDAFPHDVLLDQNGGVDFRKGCYVGQEVVSRMQHRGTARRRLMIASADAPLPSSGTGIIVAGRPIGTLGTVSGNRGLAIVRIDRVRDAMDAGQAIEAGETAIELSIPDWATYTLPDAAAEA